MNFYERYAECCKMRGILPESQAAADQLGCTRANISTFAKNQTTPKGDIVAGAARMLNVSADYLLGLIDVPLPIEHSLSGAETAFLTALRNLNSDGYTAAMAMLNGLLSDERFTQFSEE